jgi:hypothetical protein
MTAANICPFCSSLSRFAVGVLELKNAAQLAAILALVAELPVPPLELGLELGDAALCAEGFGVLLGVPELPPQPARTPVITMTATAEDRCHPVSFRMLKFCRRTARRC